MKFTTSTSVKKVAKPVAKAVKLPTQAELRASYLNLCAVTGHLKEVDMLVDNMLMAIAALSRKDATAETIRVLNIDKGLENMLGVAEEAITKQMALEGLGQQLKDGWKAIVDFIIKCVKAVRDFVGKFFQTSGHMVRTVKANADKVDFNAKLNIPAKADVNCLFDVVSKLYAADVAVLAKIAKVDMKDFKNTFDVDPSNPLIKNVADACAASNGIVNFDESTGEVSLNFSFEVKEQSLTEAGWTKADMDKLYTVALPDWYKKIVMSFTSVEQSVRNFSLDKIGAVAGAVVGQFNQQAEEDAANFIRSYKAFWNVAFSGYRAMMKIEGLFTSVAAQAYKTLPAELKKRI